MREIEKDDMKLKEIYFDIEKIYIKYFPTSWGYVHPDIIFNFFKDRILKQMTEVSKK